MYLSAFFKWHHRQDLDTRLIAIVSENEGINRDAQIALSYAAMGELQRGARLVAGPTVTPAQRAQWWATSVHSIGCAKRPPVPATMAKGTWTLNCWPITPKSSRDRVSGGGAIDKRGRELLERHVQRGHQAHTNWDGDRARIERSVVAMTATVSVSRRASCAEAFPGRTSS